MANISSILRVQDYLLQQIMVISTRKRQVRGPQAGHYESFLM